MDQQSTDWSHIEVFHSAFGKIVHELLVITPTEIVIVPKYEDYMGIGSGVTGFNLVLGAIASAIETKKTIDSIKKSNEMEDDLLKNLVRIPYSDIIKVELKRFFRGAKINIITKSKKLSYFRSIKPKGKGLFPKVDIGEYEKVLRDRLEDKLYVKK